MRSVVWVNTLQVQVCVPACTANKKGVPPGFKSVLVVMRSVVWVNTLQVQVRVPARTENKKLRLRFKSPVTRSPRREYPQGARDVALPVTQTWPYPSLRRGPTRHSDVALPVTQTWPYPSTQTWPYPSLRRGPTRHSDVALPVTQTWTILTRSNSINY
ncbi:unnamed protein product [Boreogadus saida]